MCRAREQCQAEMQALLMGLLDRSFPNLSEQNKGLQASAADAHAPHMNVLVRSSFRIQGDDAMSF